MGVQHPKLVNLFLKACFWPLKNTFSANSDSHKKKARNFIASAVVGRSPHPVSRLSTPSSHSDLWRISEVPRKKRLWFFFRFRCRNQALIWNWSSFFLSRTYSLILSTQQEVYKRKLVKLTQLDCERNQRSDFGNGKETRCSTCTYLKSWTSHCTLGWAI